MPRFFFDIADGELLVDDTGVELPDARSARGAAIRALSDIAQEKIGSGSSRAVVLSMRDENDHVVFTASLTLTDKWLVETP